MKTTKIQLRLALSFIACFCLLNTAVGQTDQDAIMMAKNNFCVGIMYGHSSWKDYWEGTYKRDNANLGTVSGTMYSIMGNYGITRRLNVLFGVPYVQTKASAGTLHGMKGVQDLSLWLKWMPVEVNAGKGTFSVYTIGGGSIPLSNYTPDFLPLSIGLHSKTLSGRLMLDYQYGSIFVTGSGTYTYRGNIKIDRNAYYTTELISSNEVQLPNVATWGLRAGYRSERLIAEGVLGSMYSLGGFDIRKNDMPFPSNKMNAMTLGVNAKYNLPWVSGLSVTGGGNYVLTGRNVGQALNLNIGAFYIFDFSGKHKEGAEQASSENK
jgi:hypothetical protein